MNTKDKSKLNGKDLISIGIFTAVYFILNLLIAAAMGFIPLVNMMIPFASSLVLGIPMMLYFSKIKKFGMVLITYIIYARSSHWQASAFTASLQALFARSSPNLF